MWRARPRISALGRAKNQQAAELKYQTILMGVLEIAWTVAARESDQSEPTTVEILDAIQEVADLVKDSVRDGRADRARAELAKASRS